MTSRHSDSLMLVWRVAAMEARNLRNPEIQPHHLFLGLCKVVDLDIPELVAKDTPKRDEVLEEFLREIRRLREVFQRSSVDPRMLRRKLRNAYGKDSLDIIEAGQLHRSKASKKIFSMAERLGDLTNFVVFPVHLLHAVLNVDDVKRDSTMAGMGIDKATLCLIAKKVVFSKETTDVSREAVKKVRLN